MTDDRARAVRYDEFLGAITRRFVGAVVAAASVAPGEVVVDLGAGLGRLGWAAHLAGATAILVEQSPDMLEAARARHPELRAVCAAGEALPFADRSIDAVVAGFFLNHLDDPAAGLAEIRRVLKPGGRLAATVWADRLAARHNSVIVEAVAAVHPEAVSARPPSDAGAGPRMLAAIAAAGFADAQAELLAATTRVWSAAHLLEGTRTTTWDNAALIEAVPPARAGALEAEVRRLVEPYRDGPGFELPASAVLLTARRPG
ncbi:tRNA methyltransferase [Baekduia alba]|uniref:class I SAM-dependent methyltransferase n=1 Tax=Baekduia alba TaxID=2997333 RepID=UPI0023401AF2|nr:class I SAM-dependent methyltransferase [Baekduia alba]WCB95285.1 tRNA methyltransferase [Baekduia alba]